MKSEGYEKIIEYGYAIGKLATEPRKNEAFLHSMLRIIDEVLGITGSLCSGLASTGERNLSHAFYLHNVSIEYAMKLVDELNKPENAVFCKNDTFVLSQLPNYKSTSFYKGFMRPQKHEDMLLQFSKNPADNNYLFVTIYLSPKVFSDTEIEIIKATCKFNIYGFLSYLKTWALSNYAKMIYENTHYYPVGIMLLKDNTHVFFANETAKGYLRDLGIYDSRMYDMFYKSHLYGYHVQGLLSQSFNRPIRIGKYLFNIVSAIGQSNSGWQLDSQTLLSNLGEEGSILSVMSSMNDITACVYIIYDNTLQAGISPSLLADLGLTKREGEIVQNTYQGLSNRDIAEKLKLSEHTVKTHLSNIYKKLGVSSRNEMLGFLLELQKRA